MIAPPKKYTVNMRGLILIRDTAKAIRELFSSRSFAYRQVFKKEDRWSTIVLVDLAKFCRAHEPTFNKDPRIHALLEGRRDVWLRIQEHLQLDDEQIFNLHKVKFLPKGSSE